MKKTFLPARRVALYDPYLDILGGGEKHILSILKVLQEEGCETSVFWDENLEIQIKNRFKLQFINKLKFLPNIFRNQSLSHSLKTSQTLKTFDYFFYVTDGSYFLSSAKKNFIFCMVPDKKLYDFGVKNKLKTLNYKFIANSRFTQSWLKNWGVTSNVIYPYIDKDFFNVSVNKLKKDKIILTVGRFYSHLHSKKQSVTVNLFNKLKQRNHLFKDFKLIIAGGLKEEDKYYFENLQKLVKNRSDIELKSNISFRELFDLYKKSLFYIHMTGFGVDEGRHPELVEHLGIAPLEGMAGGCLTFCYRAGGPKEIIAEGINGYLFQNEQELMEKMINLALNPNLQTRVQAQARKFVADNFSYKVFKKRVIEALL